MFNAGGGSYQHIPYMIKKWIKHWISMIFIPIIQSPIIFLSSYFLLTPVRKLSTKSNKFLPSQLISPTVETNRTHESCTHSFKILSVWPEIRINQICARDGFHLESGISAAKKRNQRSSSLFSEDWFTFVAPRLREKLYDQIPIFLRLALINFAKKDPVILCSSQISQRA